MAAAFVVVLAACSPPLPPIEIRPGIGADEARLQALRPPSGKTYSFRLEADGVELPGVMRLTSRRLSGERYRYSGNLELTAPTDAASLAQVAAQLERVFKTQGPKIRGNQILVPVSLTTDNRFRSLQSSLLSAEVKYAPHDCFAQLGTCRHTSQGPIGPAVPIVSETTEKDGVWRSVRRVDPDADVPNEARTLRNTYIYSLGPDGVVIDLVTIRTGNGPRSTSVMRRQ